MNDMPEWNWSNLYEPIADTTRYTCPTCLLHIDAPEGIPQNYVDAEIRSHLRTHPKPEPYGDKGTRVSLEERARLAHDLEQYHWDGAQWQTDECRMFCRIIEFLRQDDSQ